LAFVFVKLYPVFKTHNPRKRGFIMKDLKELLTVDAPAIAVLFDLFLDQPAVENDLGATAAVESVRHIFIQQWSKLEDATTSEQLRAAIHSASGVIVLIEALLHCKALGAFKQTTPKSHRIYFNAIAGVALNRFRTS
jgi:hypothetical protein